jgi:hypothetical protein
VKSARVSRADLLVLQKLKRADDVRLIISAWRDTKKWQRQLRRRSRCIAAALLISGLYGCAHNPERLACIEERPVWFNLVMPSLYTRALTDECMERKGGGR